MEKFPKKNSPKHFKKKNSKKKFQKKIPKIFPKKTKLCLNSYALQKFGGSRPAGLGGDRECTDST
jgi:hypothetical protein